MGLKLNDAFAGAHAAHDNGSGLFNVEYCNKEALVLLNRNYPPGHARRLTIGWYWDCPQHDAKRHGPFTSSRRAYQDAMATLAKKPMVA